MVYKWLKNIQRQCLPHFCAVCLQNTETNRAICNDCCNTLKFNTYSCNSCAIPMPEKNSAMTCGQCLKKTPHFDQAISLFHYEPPVRQLIHGLKFNRKLALADLLGLLMAEDLCNRQVARPECIIPVPLSNKRLRQRGFNQSLELARPISRLLDVPIDWRLVSRVRDTDTQTRLDLKARRKNVKDAFSINKNKKYQYVAILDDVMTTGATCNELARCLKKSGIKQVDVWCLARAEKGA